MHFDARWDNIAPIVLAQYRRAVPEPVKKPDRRRRLQRVNFVHSTTRDKCARAFFTPLPMIERRSPTRRATDRPPAGSETGAPVVFMGAVSGTAHRVFFDRVFVGTTAENATESSQSSSDCCCRRRKPTLRARARRARRRARQRSRRCACMVIRGREGYRARTLWRSRAW